MDEPRAINLDELSWQAHPTVAKVLTKVVENRVSNPLADALLGQVTVGGEIPWHVHESASETAYIIQGSGVLLYTQDNANRESAQKVTANAGTALTIPKGWWHTLLNTGDTPLILFAFHTPPTI